VFRRNLDMPELKANHDMGALSGHNVNGDRFTPMYKNGLRMLTFTMIIVLSSLFVSVAIRVVAAQEPTVKAEGILTEISAESATIDHGGYIISRVTKIYDMDGNRIRIEDMQVPVKVKFEYVFTEKGPFILSMRAVGV
jgi:hypothetical protein